MVDPTGVAFCVLPTKSWVTNCGPSGTEILEALRHLSKVEVCEIPKTVTADELAHLMHIAPLFATSLSMRSDCPIPLDLRFFGQMLVKCLDVGYASMAERGHEFGQWRPWGRNRHGYRETAVEDVGAVPGVCMRATADEVREMLAGQISDYFRVCPRGPRPRKTER